MHKRLKKKPIRDVLRLLAQGTSHRAISQQCGVSSQAIRDYAFRAEQTGVRWPLSDDIDDDQLQERLFPSVSPSRAVQKKRKLAQTKSVEQVMAMLLLTERQVSAMTATAMGTLRRWRCVGDGPPFIKFGSGPKARVKYDAVDIRKYVEAGRRFPSIRAGNTDGEKHGHH
jgi:hypothetical protein